MHMLNNSSKGVSSSLLSGYLWHIWLRGAVQDRSRTCKSKTHCGKVSIKKYVTRSLIAYAPFDPPPPPTPNLFFIFPVLTTTACLYIMRVKVSNTYDIFLLLSSALRTRSLSPFFPISPKRSIMWIEAIAYSSKVEKSKNDMRIIEGV